MAGEIMAELEDTEWAEFDDMKWDVRVGLTPNSGAPTIKMLQTLVSELWDVRAQIDSEKQILSMFNAQKEKLESLIIRAMQTSELERFDGDKCTVFRKSKSSVKVPASPQEKKQLLDYLKSIGMFDSMITVNSQTLNSWYNKEIEIARSNGKSEFQVPGIAEPTPYDDLSVRKK